MSPHTALSSTPISIKVSPAERQSQNLTWQNLEIATRALHRDGLVVLEDLIPVESLDILNEKMIKDAYSLQSKKNSPYNYNPGNVQQDPPLIAEYWDSSIFVNKIVTQVTSSTLGPHPRFSFISGNTALPPTATAPPLSQPTHSDADFDHPHSPFALVVNVPLVTMTPENGSTEIWLGTHEYDIAVQEGAHGDRASGRIMKKPLEQRRTIRGPCQPVIPKGSVVVRDLRLWHGGKPNLTSQPRVMLALIHFSAWYRNTMKIEFAEELESELTLQKTGLHVQASFRAKRDILDSCLDRPYGNAYDFGQEDELSILF